MVFYKHGFSFHRHMAHPRRGQSPPPPWLSPVAEKTFWWVQSVLVRKTLDSGTGL